MNVTAQRLSRSGAARRRSGVILLQASFLILVVMGLLAVVVDMGIARATQGMMQVGADVAALEALRFRDASLDPLQGDIERREAAARMAALVFDEDLDLATGPADYLLGAGPQLTTGVAGVDDPTGGLLESQGPYLPALELNVDGNEAFGDLVAGEFTPTDPLLPGNPDWHQEDGFYQRLDFAPVPAGDSPTAGAFLARLRRTNDTLGFDRQGGISSAGPTLPFLFGLGSGVLTTPEAADDPDNYNPANYDPRRDGITVRATSIAEAQPVVAAGAMSALVNGVALVGYEALDPTLPRLLSFENSSWQELLVGDSFCVLVTVDGSIFSDPTSGCVGSVTGFAQSFERVELSRLPEGFLSVGDRLIRSGSVSLLEAEDAPGIEGRRYVALYSYPPTPPTPDSNLITGFAGVRIESAERVDDQILRIEATKLASFIAPENASAVPALATDVTELLLPSEPLLAPVLVR